LTFLDVYNTENSNEAYDNFLDIFSLLHNLCFPFKLVTIKSEKKLKWISRGIRLCSKRQRQLLWQQRLKPTCENKTKFNDYSKRFKKIIKLTQSPQNSHLINNSKNKSKTAWQIINNNKTVKEPISQIKIGDKIISNPISIAESFNDFFINQITDITKRNSCNLVNLDINPHSIFMTPVVPQDVIRIIKNLKNKKSVGFDVINLQKTKTMHFHQRTPTVDTNINYDGQIIEKVNSAKFLGILIDSQLTWKPQAENICKRLSTAAFMLHNLSKKVDTPTVLLAYHGLVMSVLRFGLIFWGNCSERESIFKAQKRCLRAIFGLKVTDSCVPIFKSQKLLTFPCLYILN
ncbi:hypothetical protein SFRURICE_015536, partial [Spodoptera frugiperda]